MKCVLALLVLVGVILGVTPDKAAAAAVLATNEPLYQPGETATISGSGFVGGTTYAVPVVRPDGRLVAQGSPTCSPTATNQCWDKVSADPAGTLSYNYQLGDVLGTYEARLYSSGWSGNLTVTPMASVKFDNARTDFRQCLNDSDVDGVKDDCDWSTGASNPNNSAYVEGDTVGHRLLQVYDAAGSHTVELEYDFTKNDVYAYDFLSSVDATQSGGLLNQCGTVPSFLPASTCTSLFSGSLSIPMPSDGFDSVGLRETPGRVMRIGGTSSPPTVTIVGHTPGATCVGNCGTNTVTVQVTFSTAAADGPIGIWFGGHLASPSSAPAGWGTGFGAATISGAPFHVSLGHGGRDNQINLGPGDAPPAVPEVPFTLLLPLSAVGLSAVALGGRARRRPLAPVDVSQL